MSTTPTETLERTLPRRATLSLKDGRTLRGELVGIDEHMNVVVDDTEENGPGVTRRLGRVVVRGSSLGTVVTDAAASPRAGSR
jgi:small nuclear ribonucleoprotein (snRNP)-like protein